MDLVRKDNIEFAESENFRVYFSKVEFEGKIYPLTIIENKSNKELYFLPKEVGEILGYKNLSESLRLSPGFVKDDDNISFYCKFYHIPSLKSSLIAKKNGA